MAAMKMFLPEKGSAEEWNAAYHRLEDYLRALRLTNKIYQSQLILRWLKAAEARCQTQSGQSPMSLALEEAQAEMNQWFARILPGDSDVIIAGRVAMFIAEVPKRWPTGFLAEKPQPTIQEAMQDSAVQAGPDLQVSSMTPRPFDANPLVEVALSDPWKDQTGGASLWALFFAAVALTALFLVFLRR